MRAAGTFTHLTNAAGALAASYRYDAFGATRGLDASDGLTFAFTGEQRDTATGLYYLRARYYDPATGSFTQADPFPGLLASPQTLNPYPYVTNNPANLTDPGGRIAPLLIAAGLYAGGYFAYNYLDSRLDNGLLDAVGWLTGWENIQQDVDRMLDPCESPLAPGRPQDNGAASSHWQRRGYRSMRFGGYGRPSQN